jgi:hypothetical protein
VPHKGSVTSDEIERHLDQILASPEFQPSQRSQAFLRFVVQKTLEGAEDTIKERTIAVEVFGRSPAYDPSEDSFVRVKAGEVRRRLARYYASSRSADPVRIELPVGCYVPQFVRTESPEAIPVIPAINPTEALVPSLPAARDYPPPRMRATKIAVIIMLLVTVGAGLAWLLHRPSPIEQFWQPIHDAPGALVIFLPQPVTYAIVGEEDSRIFSGQKLPLAGSGPPAFVMPYPDKVGIGAARGAIHFVAQCIRTGKPYDIRAGEDFRFADLRRQPCVIFGAFSSKWTAELTNEFRFRFKHERNSPSQIIDTQAPDKPWREVPGEYPGVPREDYAIAGRIISPKTGQIVIIAAGLSTYGTQAAAEFLTDPTRLKELSDLTKKPLNRGSFQVLLHTSVIGNIPSSPQIIKTYFW